MAPRDFDPKTYPLAWDRSYATKGTQWRGQLNISDISHFFDLTGNTLELGSGDGNTARTLLPLARNLVCVDVSRASFDTLAMKDPKLTRIAADARKLPFDDNSFKAIFARHVLTHAIPGDDAAMLSEMKRVLAPGGMIFIEVFTPRDMRFGKGLEIFPRTFLRDDGLVWRFYMGEEMEALLKAAGLSVRHFQILSKKVRHEGEIHPRESIILMASKY